MQKETLSRLEAINSELMREVSALRQLLRKTPEQMGAVLRLQAIGWELTADIVLDQGGAIARVNARGQVTVVDEVP